MTATIHRDPAPTGPYDQPPAPPSPAHPSPAPGRIARLVRGRQDDPAWVRPALLGLLAITAVLYLWDLDVSGWANSFYAAAVEAGTKSWKAFFFGSFDSSNFITVDKPPASLWIMEISARVFGLSSWSLLVPQALEGVATVALVYAAVRRWFSAQAGLIAGSVVALTPVAALMFRYDNPDALLVLLLTGAAYATMRAIESSRTRWLVLAGALVGFGFLTKELQTLLVLPAIGAAYLVGGKGRIRKRLLQLLAGLFSMTVAGGWWVAAVMLTPGADRPYIGGSQNNTLWNVIFGYNGFGRLTGNESGSVVGGGAATGSPWGPTGLLRMFGSEMGTQISWLLPAALILLVVGLAIVGRRRLDDRLRTAMILWGGILLVTDLTFSLGQGIIHPYYTVALAPSMGAVIGIGSVELWGRRHQWPARATLAVVVAITSVWSFVLLDRVPDWLPALKYLVVTLGLTSAVLILGVHEMKKRARRALAVCALVACGAGAAAFTIDTVLTPHSGGIPTAGPTVVAAIAGAPGGGPGSRPGGGFAGGPGSAGGAPGLGGGPPGFAGGAPGLGAGGAPTRPGASAQARAGGAGAGGLLNASTPTKAMVELLEQDATKYKWVLAVTGANSAAGYQLATDLPVMAIGGFNGTDPAPTLQQFEAMVAKGEVHYYVAGGAGSGPGAGGGPGGAGAAPGASSSDDASEIQSWVESHFTSTTVAGITVYNLTSPA